VFELANLPPGPIEVAVLIQRQASFDLHSRAIHQSAITG